MWDTGQWQLLLNISWASESTFGAWNSLSCRLFLSLSFCLFQSYEAQFLNL